MTAAHGRLCEEHFLIDLNSPGLARPISAAVGMSDLLYVGQNIATRTFHPVEILTAVALIYFAIAFPLTRAVTVVEQRLLRKIEA